MSIEQVGFRAYRDNNIKLKDFGVNSPCISLHQQLLEAGLPVPNIIEIVPKSRGIITKKCEWLEGDNFDDLRKTGRLTLDDWTSFGAFFARMNMLGISAWDLVQRNIFRRANGQVIVIDLAKLYKTNFPEFPIIKYILNSVHYKDEYKEAFLEGYSLHRHIDQYELLEQLITYDYDGYQDLVINGKLYRTGARSLKRLSMLKDDFEGKKVLDLGCSAGAMFAREAKKRGALTVLGIDDTRRPENMTLVDLSAYISYLEGLNCQFYPADIEHERSQFRIKDTNWDIIFFCAILGHLKGDRVEYVKFLKGLTKVMYFETNLGGTEERIKPFFDKIGFSKIECLGDSGDPDRDPNSIYTMFRCES